MITIDVGTIGSTINTTALVQQSNRESLLQVHDLIARRVRPFVNIDNLESRIDRLTAISERLKDTQFFQVEIDISDAQKRDGVALDYRIIHRYMNRVRKSGFAVTESDLNSYTLQNHFAELRKAGVVPFIIRYDKRDNEVIYNAAMTNLENEIREAHTSLIESIGAADESYREATVELDKREAEGQQISEKDRDRAVTLYLNKARTVIQTAGERLNDAIIRAERFDATMDHNELLAGLRDAYEAYRLAFDELASLRRQKGYRCKSVEVSK